MDIVKYIVGILIEKEQVVIPGLGSFITEYNSAKINPVNNTFSPPVKGIIFDEITPEDDLLARRISDGEGISLALADGEIKNFTDQILADIQKNKIAVINGLGTFSLNYQNIITFSPTENNFIDEFFGLTEFQSQVVVRNEYNDMAPVNPIKQKKFDFERNKRNKSILVYTIIGIIFIIFVVYIYVNVPSIDDNKNNTTVARNLSYPKPKPVVETAPISTNDSAKVNDDKDTIVVVKKIPPKKVKTQENTTSETKYYIVAGSFKIEENANARAAELKAKGYPNAGVIKHVKNDLFVTYYNVFTSKDKANQEHDKINSELDKTAWVMKK